MNTDSPYLHFSREAWRQFRANTPLSLTEAELDVLRGFNHPISLPEVADIYLPLSRLINLYVKAAQELYSVTNDFLQNKTPRVPYIIGVCGSVAVGKSTTSRLLRSLLSCWPEHPHVEVVTTDGFLYPEKVLAQRGLSDKKGFPESFDRNKLIHFLQAIKSGEPKVTIPVYSHEIYDILPDTTRMITNPDILIVEGLNILQTPRVQTEGWAEALVVSDFLDFSIYVDAELALLEEWFLQRFLAFREEAKDQPDKFFYQFAQMEKDPALDLARKVWKETNERNLLENIFPFKNRAHLILHKSVGHTIEQVELRKL